RVRQSGWHSGSGTYDTARRPREELYDTQADPYQLSNLADKPDYLGELTRLRGALFDWIQETRDLGFLAESDAWKRLEGSESLREFGKDPAAYPLTTIAETASLVGDPKAVSRQVERLRNSDSAVRYGAAVGLHAAGPSPPPEARLALTKTLDDPVPSVRIEAAGAVAAADPEAAEAWAVLRAALHHPQPEVILHATPTLELLGPKAQVCAKDLRAMLDAAPSESQGGGMWMFIRFSAH